ncbi:MAG: SDR family oxidoreductase [Alphaproteobacteria bacterium]|nr:SDR family oxidoreductase [Alphaproteobacteria bacterium]
MTDNGDDGHRTAVAGRLAGRVALVCGAGSIGPGWGNGKAASVLFARAGAIVVAADRDLAAAEETAGIIAGEGGSAEAVRLDVTDADEVAAVVAATIGRRGRIDILHNNVGIAELGGPAEITLESWERVNRVNMTSAFLTCRAVLPHMRARRDGAIVNVASVAGIRWLGFPYVSYATTKAAMIQFTRVVAREYAPHNVRCNAILPGLMQTPMVAAQIRGAYGDKDVGELWSKREAQVPMDRVGTAWDVAYAALFLASEEARYVTGAELVVDGGLTL